MLTSIMDVIPLWTITFRKEQVPLFWRDKEYYTWLEHLPAIDVNQKVSSENSRFLEQMWLSNNTK